MQVFFMTFMVFSLAMIGLAIGWIINNRSLKGSCGGISALPGMENHSCSCSNPCEKRKQRMATQEARLTRQDVMQ